MKIPSHLRLGTASWSSKDWVGKFYPKGMKPGEYLSHYAQTFNTVEVDSTFYRPPTAWLCRKWVRDTPEDFRFALKVTRTITHDKVLEGCEQDFHSYLEAAEELGERLGFLLFQFAYFNKQSLCPDVASFLTRLKKFAKICPKRHRYAVEIRNPRWLDRAFIDSVRELGWGLALADQQWMPRPSALWEKFGMDLITSDFAYIRFLGERQRIDKITQKWDKIVLDRTEETREWIPILKAFLKKKIPVWVFFNNHFAGYAPASLELLKKEWVS